MSVSKLFIIILTLNSLDNILTDLTGFSIEEKYLLLSHWQCTQRTNYSN